MIGTDKQLYKKFNAEVEGRTFRTLEALSPPQNGFGGYGVSPTQTTTHSNVVLQTQISQRGNKPRTYSSSLSEDDDGIPAIQEKQTTQSNPEQWPFTDTSPSGVTSTSSNGAPLCDVISRKTLFYLISTLNAAFPDYDFTDTRSSEFSKEPNLQVNGANIEIIWFLENLYPKFYLNGSLHYSRIIFNYFLVRNEQCGQFNERDGDRTLWEGTQQLMVNLDRGNCSA